MNRYKKCAAAMGTVMLLAALATGCFPNPDGSDTGPRTGHTLSDWAGGTIDNCTVPADCIVNDKHITGNVVVDGVHVDMSDVYFEGDDTVDFGLKTVNGGSVTVLYGEFSGYLEAAIAENNWSCQYCAFHDLVADGVKLGSNVSVTDSLFIDFTPGIGSHSDGAQLQGGGVVNVIVARNTFALGDDVNSDVFIEPFFGPGDGPVVIQDNFFGGGGYSLYVVRGNDNPDNLISSVTVTGNHFWYGSYAYGPTNVDTLYNENPSPDGTGADLFVCGNGWDDTETFVPWYGAWGSEC